MKNQHKILYKHLEALYRRYNHRKYVHPDPLEFLLDYDNVQDMEIVGFIAAGLAYGRVAQILKSVAHVLEPMSDNPRVFLDSVSRPALGKIYKGFKHRFTTSDELVDVLCGLKDVNSQFGSLNECFLVCFDKADHDVVKALSTFVDELGCYSNGKRNSMVPLPSKGSACKRLNLFLRWMVRNDDVDPGGWNGISPAKLIVPLDTHMHNISLKLGLTDRKQGNMRTALEITQAFRNIVPDDPIRYDFALTRLGIRNDTEIETFLKKII